MAAILSPGRVENREETPVGAALAGRMTTVVTTLVVGTMGQSQPMSGTPSPQSDPMRPAVLRRHLWLTALLYSRLLCRGLMRAMVLSSGIALAYAHAARPRNP